MAVTGIEEIYDGTKDFIEEYLQAYLDTQEDDDNIAVPMFKQILRSSVLDILGLPVYPTLMMEYGRVEVERETTSSDRYRLPITFYAISKGSNPEVLRKKRERYVWAMKQMFDENDTMGGIVDTVMIEGYEFSPSMKRQQVFIHTGLLYTVLDVLIRRN